MDCSQLPCVKLTFQDLWSCWWKARSSSHSTGAGAGWQWRQLFLFRRPNPTQFYCESPVLSIALLLSSSLKPPHPAADCCDSHPHPCCSLCLSPTSPSCPLHSILLLLCLLSLFTKPHLAAGTLFPPPSPHLLCSARELIILINYHGYNIVQQNQSL